MYLATAELHSRERQRDEAPKKVAITKAPGIGATRGMFDEEVLA